jgi:hypothetical protein
VLATAEKKRREPADPMRPSDEIGVRARRNAKNLSQATLIEKLK